MSARVPHPTFTLDRRMLDGVQSVAVGLSGGVDSSLAAALLGEAGVAVSGLFMKNWEEDDTEGCAAAADLASATAVAAHLGIELRTVNFATEYWDRVFLQFLDGYRRGRTPNPDVLCNREIKFGEFREHAATLGASHMATGHYARLRRDAHGVRLLRARDEAKDQTYFLHALDQQALANVLFPLGELDKGQVRAMARTRGLPSHARPDSTGICFIGERPFRSFLGRYLQARPGPILDERGRQVGEHRGAALYTIGQRRGLGVGGHAGDDGSPWYVFDRDVTSNTVHVVRGQDHPLLYCDGVQASACSWVSGTAPWAEPDAPPVALQARCRHRQPLQDCHLTPLADGAMQVSFAQPQRAIAPGQFVVIYRGVRCLGGATIERTLRSADTALARAG